MTTAAATPAIRARRSAVLVAATVCFFASIAGFLGSIVVGAIAGAVGDIDQSYDLLTYPAAAGILTGPLMIAALVLSIVGIRRSGRFGRVLLILSAILSVFVVIAGVAALVTALQ